MCANLINGAVIFGVATLALTSGAWVGGKAGAQDTKYYTYKYVSGTTVKKGFACKCRLVNNSPRWRGKDKTNSCSTDGVVDNVYKLNETPLPQMPNVPIPDGACCRNKPKATGLTGVNIPDNGACLP